jgi:hypothetical protein
MVHQHIKTLSCINVSLSIIAVTWTIVSISYIMDIATSDRIIINSDKIKCERFFNNNIDGWLCAGNTPGEVNRAIILPPVVVVLMGIGICICSCVIINKAEIKEPLVV